MRITHFLLGLGLLGLFGMAFATSKDNLSSLPPSKETPSDPQVIKLVMKLEDILKKKNEIFFEKEALDELINRIEAEKNNSVNSGVQNNNQNQSFIGF